MDYPNKTKHESEILSALTFNPPTPPKLTSTVLLQCLKCERNFSFPVEKDIYLAHLFTNHRLVIADVEEIALLEEYLKFWQQEFVGHELAEYCHTMLLDTLPDGTPSPNEKYYLLSQVLPKDYEVRTKLKQQRLERALAQHQYERTDRTFTKECLYCRDVITGLRSEFIEHLYAKHFLLLGKPEHLVYVDQLLDKISSNLEQLICLYCQKIFKDRVTLKEHMRKKAHKRINPDLKEYDKYFLVNYHNEGMNTQFLNNPRQNNQRQRHNQRQTQQQLVQKERKQSGSVDFEQRFADDEADWAEWHTENPSLLNCLFCAEQATELEQLNDHMLACHAVDFMEGIRELNFYEKIKLVNYVRRQVRLQRCVTCDMRCGSASDLLEHMRVDQHFGLGTRCQWNKPEYFFPTYEDDGLLCVLDDNPDDSFEEARVVPVISEDTRVQINKEAELLSLENFNLL